MRDRSLHAVRWLQLAVILMLAFAVGSVSSRRAYAAYGDNYNISINGTFEYKKAFDLLEQINTLRGTSNVLAMDENLMQHAMQRAAEASCLYHNDLRPNYTDALSIDAKAAESSILFGKKTAAKAVASLGKKSRSKKAMLNTSYKSVGIGCFTISKYTYWYILYSEKSAESLANHADRLARVVTVNVTESMSMLKAGVDGQLMDSISLFAKNTIEMTPMWLDRSSGLSSNVSFPVEVSSFRFSSSNTDVATVDSKGVITTVAPGSAVITAVPRVATGTVAGVSVTVKVKKNQIKAALEEDSFTYTGQEIKPTVTVKKGKTTLTPDKDYSVDYANNVNPGYGTATVTGLGTYAGQTLTLRFAVLPAKSTVTLTTTSGSLTASWKKVKKISGYQIEVATSKDMQDDLVTKNVNYKKRTLTFSDMESGVTYYVRVRAYKKVDGEKLYGSWSKIKKITVK